MLKKQFKWKLMLAVGVLCFVMATSCSDSTSGLKAPDDEPADEELEEYRDIPTEDQVRGNLLQVIGSVLYYSTASGLKDETSLADNMAKR